MLFLMVTSIMFLTLCAHLLLADVLITLDSRSSFVSIKFNILKLIYLSFLLKWYRR